MIRDLSSDSNIKFEKQKEDMDNAVLKKKKYKAEIIELKSSNKKNELEIVEKEEIEQERFD